MSFRYPEPCNEITEAPSPTPFTAKQYFATWQKMESFNQAVDIDNGDETKHFEKESKLFGTWVLTQSARNKLIIKLLFFFMICLGVYGIVYSSNKPQLSGAYFCS